MDSRIYMHSLFSFPQFLIIYTCLPASLVTQMVSACNAETRVRSLCCEDLLEKGMGIHSNILAWKIPWTGEPGRLYPWGCKELDMTERLIHTYTYLSIIFSLLWPWVNFVLYEYLYLVLTNHSYVTVSVFGCLNVFFFLLLIHSLVRVHRINVLWVSVSL